MMTTVQPDPSADEPAAGAPAWLSDARPASWRDIAVGQAARSAGAALRDSEARFRALADQDLAGVVMTDRDGRCLFCNSRFASLLARGSDSLRGVTISELTHPEDRAESDARFARMIETGLGYVLESRLLRADGSPAPVRCAVSARHGGPGPAGGLALVLDLGPELAAEAVFERMPRDRAAMAAGLRHRTRNPVAVVRLSVQQTPRRTASRAERAVRALDGNQLGRAGVETSRRSEPGTCAGGWRSRSEV